MNSHLTDVPAAIRLSRATMRNIHENLFWAFIYNIIGHPAWRRGVYSLLGWQLNPMFGAAAMSLSSFCVVSNALRLNLFDPHSARKDHKIKFAKEPKPCRNPEDRRHDVHPLFPAASKGAGGAARRRFRRSEP